MFRFFTYLLFLFSPFWSFGQTHQFTRYSEKDGLKNRFVYTVDQDERGYLMIGTGEGLYSYDGFTFKEYTTANGLISNVITCSEVNKNGVIWYGHNNGSLTKYTNGRLDTINLSSYTHSRINQIEGNEETLWVLTQNDGLLKKDKNNHWTQYKQGIEEYVLFSFYIDKWNRIWLGTDMGLLLCTINGEIIEYNFIDEIIESKVSCIYPKEGELIVGTEDIGIFKIDIRNEEYMVSPIHFEEVDFSSYNVNSLYVSPANDLWVCSNNKGLVQLSGFVNGQYRKKIEHTGKEDFNATSINVCTGDREGNIWVGTIGDGLTKIQDRYLTLYHHTETITYKSLCIYEQNDTIWSGSVGRINIYYGTPDNLIDSIGTNYGLPEDEITNLSIDKEGTLWIGTHKSGLFKLGHGEKRIKKVKLPDGAELLHIHDILLNNSTVYVASDYGVYQFQNEKLLSHITIQSGLSLNNVKSLFRDMKGRVWFATTTSQITYVEEGEIKNLKSGSYEAPSQILCITEDNSGNIWIGTDGMGIIRVSGDSVKIFNKTSGIYSDYCYSIVCDQKNNLWVGHHGAMSKVNLINGKIEIFDPNGQFDTDFVDNAVHRTKNGTILFSTSNGVLSYNPENDIKNEIEPVLRIEQTVINDSIALYDEMIDLKYGKYNIQFDFIGISLKNATGVRYQYYLEGYDNEWLELTSESSALYNNLGPGSYVFHVKCFNSDGFGGTEIISIPIFIDKPFWEKWWFIGLCLLLIVISIRYIIKRRERILIENQIRLQKALDERTKEVVEQKELLEIKNKDITDSILYAKNIQQAMLPTAGQLGQYFSDTFVYFKPRDIVSGDFYWVEQYGKTIVVSCADCTGHGVPGAFMSLIGSTLLKDVAGYSEVQSSAEVLTYLDRELKEMLHKRGDSLSIHDGMDICVMDFNTETRKLRIASANRPVFLYHNDQWIEIRGDRQSIGGDEIQNKKEFVLHEYQIHEGDMIYMFSDGITDQFGGSEGKKLKRSGFKNWLDSIYRLPMNQQSSILHEKFEQWKSGGDQIDDVIVLGIKF